MRLHDDCDDWYDILIRYVNGFFSGHPFRLCSLNEFGHIMLLNLFIGPCSALRYISVRACSFCLLFSALFSSGFILFLRSVFTASLRVTVWQLGALILITRSETKFSVINLMVLVFFFILLSNFLTAAW